MTHLVKAFKDFAPDLEILREKIILRIQDLMVTIPAPVFKVMKYGAADSLGITTGEGNVKVASITYNTNKCSVFVETANGKTLHVAELNHDDLNAIYENLYNNIVNHA